MDGLFFVHRFFVGWTAASVEIVVGLCAICFFVVGFVGVYVGEIGVNWEKISTFVCANMQLLFNPLKFYDYDEH